MIYFTDFIRKKIVLHLSFACQPASGLALLATGPYLHLQAVVWAMWSLAALILKHRKAFPNSICDLYF